MLFLVNLSHTATKIISEPGNLSMSLIGLLGYCGSTGSNSFNQKKIPKMSTTWKTMEPTLLMCFTDIEKFVTLDETYIKPIVEEYKPRSYCTFICIILSC